MITEEKKKAIFKCLHPSDYICAPNNFCLIFKMNSVSGYFKVEVFSNDVTLSYHKSHIQYRLIYIFNSFGDIIYTSSSSDYNFLKEALKEKVQAIQNILKPNSVRFIKED